MRNPVQIPPISEIKAKALEALNDGKLQVQQPDAFGESCLYAGPCAIGVALSPEDRERLDAMLPDQTGIRFLWEHGFVKIAPGDDIAELQEIQSYHDNHMLDQLRRILEN